MICKNNLNTGRRTDKKWKPTPHSKKEHIGLPTGLLDMNGNEIKCGNKVRIKSDYEGIVLYHRYMGEYGLFFGLWYGERNPYDADCYGKYITIPKDNGMRMYIEII